jgi:hypothetical protein
MRCLLNLSGSELGIVTVSLGTVVKFVVHERLGVYHQVSLVQVGLCLAASVV